MSEDTVWTAAASPHVITESVRIRDGAALTIEPCAEVLVAAGKSLEVGLFDTEATLIAEGTAARPISFRGRDATPWGAIWLHTSATGRLRHVSIENGGAETSFGSRNASIFVSGDQHEPAQPRLLVEQVTLRDSVGPGVHLTGDAAFAAGSTGLVIQGSGNEENPYPVLVTPTGAGSLPTGSYTGNLKDEIGLLPTMDIAEPVTFADRGVPYRVMGIPGSYLRVAGRDGAEAMLTLEAGVKVRFEPGTSLWIGDGLESAPDRGALRAAGTAQQPVVLTSAADSPGAGDWMGIQFRGGAFSAANRMEYTRVEYAGGECSCAGFSCAPGGEQEAAIHFFSVAPEAAFITNSTIFRSAGHGINRGWSQSDHPGISTSFLEGNVFEGVAGCRETLYRDMLNGCPNPPPCP